MALPLLFFIGSSLIRAATPAIARLLIKQGYKKASSAVVKNTIKNAKKIRTIGNKKDIPIAKNKSLTIPKNQSTALTKIDKVTGGAKSKLINGKVIAAASTVAGVPSLIAKDDKKGEAKADTKKNKVDVALREALKKKKAKDAKDKADATRKSTREQKSKVTTAITTKKKGSDKVGGGPKVIVTKEQLEKSGLSLRDYMNMLESKRLGRKISRDPRNDKKTVKKSEKKTEKKVDKKTPNYGGSRAIPKKTEPKKNKSFLDRVKSDFNKAVKETKRNFSDKRYFVNGVDSRKEKIKSKSNIKKKK